MRHTMLRGYKLLLEINSGYDHVIRGLAALRGDAAFDREQLNPFRELAEEARSSTSSYLTGALETVEAEAAGRHFGRRLRRERRDERGE
jgi:hypothetical protein